MTNINSSYVYDERKRCYVPVSTTAAPASQRSLLDRMKRTLTTAFIVIVLLAGIWLAVCHVMGGFSGGGLLGRDVRDPSILRSQ